MGQVGPGPCQAVQQGGQRAAHALLVYHHCVCHPTLLLLLHACEELLALINVAIHPHTSHHIYTQPSLATTPNLSL